MDKVYECTKDLDSLTMEDIQSFYAKSKVPICLAIADSFHFLNEVKDACFLSEEEALELQGDTRTAHRVVYECLCCIEEKKFNLQHFFEFLFQNSFLKRYPDLTPIRKDYKAGKYRDGIHSTADKDKDPHIFAQEKVRICLTITDRFPFLHGLQDLAFLSESESLKLQADERPDSRVIYESLSLIEKKDMKLNIVFEYIFQPCYLKLYPGLQNILLEPSGEFVAPFNGGQYPMFNIATDLLEFFEHNKTYICEAVNERFPFLHGLHDLGLLSYIQLLRLQADKTSTKEVLYKALCHIQDISDIETFFAYVFQELYLKLYPNLHVILECLNAALTLDICLPSTVIVKDENMERPVQDSSEPSPASYEEQESSEPSTVIPKDEILEIPKQDSIEPSPVSYTNGTREKTEEQDSKEPSSGFNDVLPSPIRKCRMQPISYSEPPDLDWEVNNGRKKHNAPENSKCHKYGKRKSQATNLFALKRKSLDLGERPEPVQGERPEPVQGERPEPVQVIKPVIVKLEFPKQVFNEKFKVHCGDKTGIFKKSRWTGDSRHDLCILSEGKYFSVTTFEKFGGKGSSKNWKKTIQCEEIRLECLIKAGILKCPIWVRKTKVLDPDPECAEKR